MGSTAARLRVSVSLHPAALSQPAQRTKWRSSGIRGMLIAPARVVRDACIGTGSWAQQVPIHQRSQARGPGPTCRTDIQSDIAL